jgi:DNA-binding MltR family transcriptional regulator
MTTVVIMCILFAYGISKLVIMFKRDDTEQAVKSVYEALINNEEPLEIDEDKFAFAIRIRSSTGKF